MKTACVIFATVIALHSGQAPAQEEGARPIDRTGAPLILRTRIACLAFTDAWTTSAGIPSAAC
jgi:hypothetical protein